MIRRFFLVFALVLSVLVAGLVLARPRFDPHTDPGAPQHRHNNHPVTPYTFEEE